MCSVSAACFGGSDDYESTGTILCDSDYFTPFCLRPDPSRAGGRPEHNMVGHNVGAAAATD